MTLEALIAQLESRFTNQTSSLEQVCITLSVCLSVCVYVCLSAGHERVPCESGRTDRDVFWSVNSGWAKEPLPGKMKMCIGNSSNSLNCRNKRQIDIVNCLQLPSTHEEDFLDFNSFGAFRCALISSFVE